MKIKVWWGMNRKSKYLFLFFLISFIPIRIRVFVAKQGSIYHPKRSTATFVTTVMVWKCCYRNINHRKEIHIYSEHYFYISLFFYGITLQQKRAQQINSNAYFNHIGVVWKSVSQKHTEQGNERP